MSDEPTKPVEQPQVVPTPEVDVSKLSDEAFDKVFDDERIWKHPRFKTLSEKAKKASEYETQIKQTEEAKLLEQKKFEELATLKTKELEDFKSRLQNETIKNRIILESTKIGVVDPDAVIALIDRSNIKVEDDGTVRGIDEALTSLKSAKSYLFNGTNASLGSGTNPSGNQSDGKIKLSEVQNPVYFQANEAKIMKAMQSGNIVDDVN